MRFCKRLLQLLAALAARRPEIIFPMLKGGLYYVDSHFLRLLAVPGRGIGILVL
jgi:hypothetical protein